MTLCPKIFAKLSTAAMLLSVGFTVSAQQGMPPAQVEVTLAETRMMNPEITVTGTVISLNDSAIASEIEGPLDWIAQVGEKVKKGDVVARLDKRLLVIAERHTKASMRRLEASLRYRESDLARLQSLADGDVASKARLEEAIAARDMLVQEIATAKALYDQAVGDVSRADIRAPFDGYITSRLANKGEFITKGNALVRLVDTGSAEVTIPAPISVVPFIKAGASVHVENGSDSKMLPIRAIVPVGDMVSRMVEVRLTVTPDTWVIGTPVKVHLPTDTEALAVVVPRDAIVLKAGKPYLFKIRDDLTAEMITATIKSSVGLSVAITDGIAVGDRIVVRGGERLMDGQRVTILD